MMFEILILSNSILLLAYVLFKWISKGTRFFTLNRYYLLTLPFIALLFPLLPTMQTQNLSSFQLPTINLKQVEVALNETNSIDIVTFVIVIGAIVQLIRVLYRCWNIFKLDRSNLLTTINDIPVYRTDYSQSFSVGKEIFLSNSNIDDAEIIIQHELVHVKQLHTIDILVYQVLSILFWINPVIYLLEKEVKENHEFIVDEIIVKNNPFDTYAYSILNTQLNSTYPHIGAGFNKKSTILKRIQKMKTQNNYIMKHLVLIPALVIGSTLMTSMTTVTPDIKTEKVNPEEGVEQPTFKGGFDALVKFMGENIQYPKSVQNREATVFVSFMVQENGSISDAKVLKSSGETAFDKEAIRVINLMPNWIPGTKNGKVSAMEMKLPIKFTDK